MNQYQSSAELKNTAREMLSGKYGISILVGIFMPLTIFLMKLPFQFLFTTIFAVKEITSGVPVNTAIIVLTEDIINIPCAIIGGILQTGLSLYFLNIACGKHHSLSDLFFGFRWQRKKSLALSAIFVLLNVICMLPYSILSYHLELPYEVGKMIPVLLAYLGGVIIQLPISLMLSQAFYLLLDFPQLSTKQLLQRSIRIMKGHKKRLLYIQLSFLPLELLCILSFGIGSLWLNPYKNMTYALFFLDLMNPQKVSGQSTSYHE